MRKTQGKDRLGKWALISVLLGLVGEFFIAQNGIAWALWVGLALAGAAVYLFLSRIPAEAPQAIPDSRTEWVAAGLIFALAVFFRVYRIGEMPPGIFRDLGHASLASERILWEGWRPFFELYHYGFGEIPVYYFLAGWFGLFHVSRYSIFGFSIFFSLLGLILSYFCFRQLTGRRTALVAVFIMAVLRWYLTFSRCATPAFEIPFYIGGVLCFWLYAHSTDRKWAWALSLFFLCLGTYSGIFLRGLFLALFLWALFEWRKADEKRKAALIKRYLCYFPLAFLLTLPIWFYMAVSRSLGPGSEGQSLWERIGREGWAFLPSHFLGYALMFQEKADPWPIYNFSNYPVLDIVTACFFLFGFCRALLGFKEKYSFYALSGFGVMSLPAVLSGADAPVSRSVGVLIFVVLFAGQSFVELGETLQRDKSTQRYAVGLAGLLLVFLAGLNFKQYFYDQARQPDECQDHWAGATAVGEKLALSAEDQIYLTARFYRNFDVDMLAFDKRPKFRLFFPWDLPREGGRVSKSVIFALDEGKTGLLQLLEKRYPQGTVETYDCPDGWPLAYFYRVQAGSLVSETRMGGIRGVYWLSEDRRGPPVFERADPVLNFTFRNDFGLEDFKTLSVRWTGIVMASQSGPYSFLALTTDQAAVRVDGKKVFEGTGTQERAVSLSPGRHSIQVDFQKLSGVDTAFNLLWKTPGNAKYQVIPFWQWPPVFGKAQNP